MLTERALLIEIRQLPIADNGSDEVFGVVENGFDVVVRVLLLAFEVAIYRICRCLWKANVQRLQGGRGAFEASSRWPRGALTLPFMVNVE